MDSNWIWVNEWRDEHEKAPTMVFFRKKIKIENPVQKAEIWISADSRYKLYVNDTLVEVGPSKGDLQIWYKDRLDISEYLKKGDNVIAVMVLRYPLHPMVGNQSVVTTYLPGLYFDGHVLDTKNIDYDISADATWCYRIYEEMTINPEDKGFAPLHIYETIHQKEGVWQWKSISFNDDTWETAKPYHKGHVRDGMSPGNLQPRTIPYMFRKPQRFKAVMPSAQSTDRALWEQLISDEVPVVIAPNTEQIIELDAGEEMTGYLTMLMSHGSGAKVTLLQSEAYVQNGQKMEGNIPIKENRMDYIGGHLEGFEDVYYPAGDGSVNEPEVYEPFWFRTFRFIRLHIVTTDEPLTIYSFDYCETGYPLEVSTSVTTSDENLEAIWDLSRRTLQRCMHETYEDCPFYEQLQYVMDSRSQILYTYAVSADDRLARQCMDDFKRAQRYDGLLYSAYPNKKPNIIPGFSFYYILMLHDHMMYFGDKTLIKDHMMTVEAILNFFEKHESDMGYLGQIGGYYRQANFWSFVDWTADWKIGVPNAISEGPLTMESLLYVLGLQRASELAGFIGYEEQSERYAKTAREVQKSIRDHCIGSNGLVQDGPGFEEYSQHSQVFAIITETLDKEEGQKALLATIKNKQAHAQCSVAMIHYLFRALAIVDLYDYTDEYWGVWRKMIEQNMTTSAESDSYCRSECHAWGAVALYELPAVTLGVRPASPGFSDVYIQPVPGYLTHAEGTVITPKGPITVSWRKDEGKGLQLTYQLPDNMTVLED